MNGEAVLPVSNMQFSSRRPKVRLRSISNHLIVCRILGEGGGGGLGGGAVAFPAKCIDARLGLANSHQAS